VRKALLCKGHCFCLEGRVLYYIVSWYLRFKILSNVNIDYVSIVYWYFINWKKTVLVK
jgi:hypothetical protein